MIEKAWAKYLKSYQNTVAGHPNDVFTILTGAPSALLDVPTYTTSESQKNILWEQLSKGYLYNYFICSSTHGKGDFDKNLELNSDLVKILEEMKNMNFVLNHAYSILVSYEFESSGQKTRLIKLRNPWGKANKDKLDGEKFYNSNSSDYLPLPT